MKTNENLTNQELNEQNENEIPMFESKKSASGQPKTKAAMSKLKEELESQSDKYLRVCAEYENYRKRTTKELEESFSRGQVHSIKSFLPFIDSLEKAQQFAPEDQGIKALTKQLTDILGSLGVTEMVSDGMDFDPNLHNAILHEEDCDTEGCKVVATFQKGYMLGDMVIRHAMVKVVN